MSRVFEEAQAAGGVRLLVIGAAHYPDAQTSKPKVPKLPDIGSAARSAIDFACGMLVDWRHLLPKPLASVDLLANDAANPDGITFSCKDVLSVKVAAPTLANIVAARTRWIKDAGKDDILIFYCCGHGIWIPSITRTFLASDFGTDPESVWPNAISIDLFIEGMGDKAPREQWLIFDCCANTPPPRLRNARPAVNPLVEPTEGLRKTMTDLNGPLTQVVIASSSLGSKAFGRTDGRSRFMDVFADACADSGFRDQDREGRWVLSVQGLEDAMSTYCFRVARFEDIAYYTFSRLTTSDAERPPVLMRRDTPAACTLLVTSEPPVRLKQCTLDLLHGGARIDGHVPLTAEARFRRTVEPFEYYQVDAAWPAEAPQSRKRRALPPLTEIRF